MNGDINGSMPGPSRAQELGSAKGMGQNLEGDLENALNQIQKENQHAMVIEIPQNIGKAFDNKRPSTQGHQKSRGKQRKKMNNLRKSLDKVTDKTQARKVPTFLAPPNPSQTNDLGPLGQTTQGNQEDYCKQTVDTEQIYPMIEHQNNDIAQYIDKQMRGIQQHQLENDLSRISQDKSKSSYMSMSLNTASHVAKRKEIQNQKKKYMQH